MTLTYRRAVYKAIAVTDATDPVNVATCGTCGCSWDDSVSTSLTPAPSGRCPFEDEHVYPEEPARIPLMNKTSRVRRARDVRAGLAEFVGYQGTAMREFIQREWRRDPDNAAMRRLLLAQHNLNALVSDLQAAGYGQ